MPNVRTIYNPGVAMVYVIKNVLTGECVNASTCGIKDIDFKPWRSPKGTKVGEEFFKMKIGNKRQGFKSITFLNSSTHEKCLSEDKEWEFIGQRPDGSILPKLADMLPNSKNTNRTIPPTNTNAIKKVKASIEKVLNTDLTLTTNQLQTTIETEEFVDVEEMNKILN